MTTVYRVRFKQSYLTYGTGDVAGFCEVDALRFVKYGVGEVVESFAEDGPPRRRLHGTDKGPDGRVLPWPGAGERELAGIISLEPVE